MHNVLLQVYVDNVEGEWGAFNEIVKRKESSVQTQIGTLQMQIVAEDRAVEQKTAELLQLWEKDKPVQVSVCLQYVVSRVGVSVGVCVHTVYKGDFLLYRPLSLSLLLSCSLSLSLSPALRVSFVQTMPPTC